MSREDAVKEGWEALMRKPKRGRVKCSVLLGSWTVFLKSHDRAPRNPQIAPSGPSSRNSLQREWYFATVARGSGSSNQSVNHHLQLSLLGNPSLKKWSIFAYLGIYFFLLFQSRSGHNLLSNNSHRPDSLNSSCRQGSVSTFHRCHLASLHHSMGQSTNKEPVKKVTICLVSTVTCC